MKTPLWSVFENGYLVAALPRALVFELYGKRSLNIPCFAIRRRANTTSKTFPFAVMDTRVGLEMTAAEAGPLIRKLSNLPTSPCFTA